MASPQYGMSSLGDDRDSGGGIWQSALNETWRGKSKENEIMERATE